MTVFNLLIGISVLLALTVGIGITMGVRQRRKRRRVSATAVGPELLSADALGERATLLQFSTDFCARCPAVHQDLADVAGVHAGVTHVNIDLTHRPDLAKRFHVLQTPTTLILDRHGVIVTRFGGVPHRGVIEFELARVMDEGCTAA